MNRNGVEDVSEVINTQYLKNMYGFTYTYFVQKCKENQMLLKLIQSL